MGNGDKKNKSSYVKYILILVVVFILSGMVGAFFANALVDNKPDYNEDDKKVNSTSRQVSSSAHPIKSQTADL